MNTRTLKTDIPGLDLSDLGKPSLHALSYALRHPDTWPEGFVWNYGSCERCAMGLARALWRQIPKANNDSGASIMARQFAMPYGAASSIFMGTDLKWLPTDNFTEGHLWWKRYMRRANYGRVTPEMVAAQIDRYLATAE